MNIFILGRGNYYKCIIKNYKNKANFYTIDNYLKDIIYDFVIITYPTHVLETKLNILSNFNWTTLIHMQTNGWVLEKYIPIINKFNQKNFIFLQFGIWHTRDGIIFNKYNNIPYLCIGKIKNINLINYLFDIRLKHSDNIPEFIINYHNLIIHTVLISWNKDRKYFYNYDLKNNIKFIKYFTKVATEMNSIYKQYTNQDYNFYEKAFYYYYKYKLCFFIPLFMLKIDFPSNESRLFQEDLLSFSYIYENRKNIKANTIKNILDINNYKNYEISTNMENVINFYKNKINKKKNNKILKLITLIILLYFLYYYNSLNHCLS